VREQIAAQPAAPELSRKAAAAAAAPKAVAHHGAREAHKAERKVAHAAPARALKVATPAPKAEKPAPVTQARGEKSAPVASKVEPPEPKAEAKPVEAKKPAKPQSVADLAVQAAAVATDNRPSKGAAKPSSELDELMDNVLNSKSEKGKKQKMADDPIYGL
jgi:hypothetical protein